MAVIPELSELSDELREQMRDTMAELRDEFHCSCSNRPRVPYVDYIDEVHVHHGEYTLRDISVARDRIWSNQ